MSLTLLEEFFLWMSIINFAILLWWFFLYSFKKELIKKLHTILFSIEQESFDAIHYKAMVYFKLGIILFNLTPYIVLQIIS